MLLLAIQVIHPEGKKGRKTSCCKLIAPSYRTVKEDIKILYNDWPYGLDKGIVHLVVWSKRQLEQDPRTGDLTLAARRTVDEYVTRKFRVPVGSERVCRPSASFDKAAGRLT